MSFPKRMSSWGPGFVQKKGHMILPYYHFVGFGDYADEFFKFVRSLFYAYQSNEFMFVFDKVNSASTTIGLFEYTLKRNNVSRYLSYYPTQGFNIGERRDILETMFQRGYHPDKLNFFSFFTSIFELQDKIKEQIMSLYGRAEISLFETDRIGVCLDAGESDFSSLIEKLSTFAARPGDPLSVFVSSFSKDQATQFRNQCPTNWKVVSHWDTLPPVIQTEEQKLEILVAFLGALVGLSYCSHLIGKFQHPVFRFLYCKEAKFRTPSNTTVLDSSSFSYF